MVTLIVTLRVPHLPLRNEIDQRSDIFSLLRQLKRCMSNLTIKIDQSLLDAKNAHLSHRSTSQ